MSLCVLGMAEEFKGEIAVNALWPKTGMYLTKNPFIGFSFIVFDILCWVGWGVSE